MVCLLNVFAKTASHRIPSETAESEFEAQADCTEKAGSCSEHTYVVLAKIERFEFKVEKVLILKKHF